MTMNIFAINDAIYAAKRLVGVPITPGEKRPALHGWQELGSLDEWERSRLRTQYADCGIGLLAGTALSAACSFGFIDIDSDWFTPFVIQALGGSPCAKRGAKGSTIFVRCTHDITNTRLRAKGLAAPVAEVLASRRLTVIPPSIHPSGTAYEWVGTPLPEMELDLLPLLTPEKLNLIKAIGEDASVPAVADRDGFGAYPKLPRRMSSHT